MNLDVANTIAAQIGRRAFMMMGTKFKGGGENYLSFDIRGCKDFSHIRITLENDMYTVEFIKIRGTKQTNYRKVEGVYVENLNVTIETNTGLFLSL